DIVPTWDGDASSLARWVIRVNAIAKKSDTIRAQLGTIVPQRLTGRAERWYYSLPEPRREDCERGWDEIRAVIGSFYMNRSWLDKTRKEALALKYRERGHEHEYPSDYFIRKKELLELAYDNSEREINADIMAGAPFSWHTLIPVDSFDSTEELQTALKLREEELLRVEAL
ncbi:hypothetical protein OH76DRAFT_1304501, partial [Lentinus brumalis]